MNTEMLVQLFFSGLTYGSIYVIVAIGFNIIYNSTEIINFAQGEFVMVGGMLSYTFNSFLPLWASIPIAVLVTALIGSFMEFTFLRSLNKVGLIMLNIITFGVVLLICSLLFSNKSETSALFLAITGGTAASALIALNLIWKVSPSFQRLFIKKAKPNVLQMIVVTIGLSIIIREIALQVWGAQVKTLPFFTGDETSSIALLGAHFSPQVLWVLGLTGLVVIALSLFFKYTLVGQAMRACADTTEGASLCGINPQLIVNLSFALSAGIGAFAGCIIAPLTQIQYSMGTELAIKGFTVAIFGGFGNSTGALLGGLILGIMESFAIVAFPEAYKNIITIGILLLVLFFRPSGLLGTKKSRTVREF
jgi:Branched-chain amino acid ABC-type transport system, permease components